MLHLKFWPASTGQRVSGCFNEQRIRPQTILDGRNTVGKVVRMEKVNLFKREPVSCLPTACSYPVPCPHVAKVSKPDVAASPQRHSGGCLQFVRVPLRILSIRAYSSVTDDEVQHPGKSHLTRIVLHSAGMFFDHSRRIGDVDFLCKPPIICAERISCAKPGGAQIAALPTLL